MASKSNTHNTHTHNTEREHTMASKSNTQQSNTQPEPAWPVPRGYFVTAWSVKGRGKSATYCAAMPAGTGKPGQSVAMIAKSGAVTLATLSEVREQSEGITRWDFDRVKLSPEQQAANRAAKSASTASYWQSPAGLETAQRIAERQAAKSAQQSEPEPEQDTQPEPEPASTAAPEQDMAAMAAAMRSAGFTAAEVLAALSQQSPTASPSPSPSPSKPAKSPSKPRASKPEPEQSPAGLALCDACNRERRGVKPHSGAPELETCPRCSTLDADTARVRAERHS